MPVAYATGDGSAVSGSDYQALSGTLTFAPGETTKTITVLVNGDRLAEQTESFVVNLSSPTNATVTDGQGVGTIVDDEPRISISDVTKSERPEKQDNAVHVHGHALGGLRPGRDDVVPNGERHRDHERRRLRGQDRDMTFAPGETTKTITIEVKGDNKRRPTRHSTWTCSD